jgi:hypothetical protein
MSDSAEDRSPVQSSITARELNAGGSSVKVPVERAISMWRADSASQLVSSHKCSAAIPASHKHRSSSTQEVMAALTARREIGAAAAYPSVECAARPSRRRSDTRDVDGGDVAAALATSATPQPLAKRPEYIAADFSSRYVVREGVTSIG